MILAALAQVAAASLRIGLGDSSEATIQVVNDGSTGYRLKVDCLNKCARPLHYSTPISDTPLGLLDLDHDGLVYSVWGTGCCYIVRVWKVTANGVTKLLETGSRGVPSLVTAPRLAIVTYMRPTDASARETSVALRPIRWTYSGGRFVAD
jgi:hypothetical protein